MIELEACVATRSWVNREYRRGLRGVARHEAQDPVAPGGVETLGLKLNDELGGYYGVEC